MSVTATRERPILFSGEMVRAILAGRKTQTRRVVTPQPPADADEVFVCLDAQPLAHSNPGVWARRHSTDADSPDGRLLYLGKNPYGWPGDRLWVRETWFCDDVRLTIPTEQEAAEFSLRDFTYYLADGTCCEQIPECACDEVGKTKWRPSIHMPRWASRLTLEITGVRVERLRDISAADAQAEGIEPRPEHAGLWRRYGSGCPWWTGNAIKSFCGLWNSINGNRSGCDWQSNPFVWVIEFRRCEQ